MSTSTISGGVALLKNPNVSKMFIAYLVSYTGTAMAPIAIAFGVLELTGSTKDSSVVIAAPTLASIVVLLIGGVVADRTSRKRVIYSSEIVAMSAQLALAFLFLSGLATIPWLTFFMLIMGFAMAFHGPASTGLIIQLVDKEDLQAANAVLGIARNGAITGGAALGGVLVSLVGAGYTLIIDALTFGVSAILVFTLKPKLQTPPEPASLLRDLKLGWREFTSHTWLWVMVLQFALIVGAGEGVFGLVGPAVTRDYMEGAVDWGIIAAGFGLGTLCGGLTAIRITPKHPMRVGATLVLFFAGVEITLAFLLPVAVIAFAAFVSGFCGQIFAVLWYTTLQTKVPPDMLSRVSAYDHLGSIALAPMGVVVFGYLYEAIGYQETLIIAALTVILPTLAVLCVRDVRHMTAEPMTTELKTAKAERTE